MWFSKATEHIKEKKDESRTEEGRKALMPGIQKE
jgi:hypothetical protein